MDELVLTVEQAKDGLTQGIVALNAIIIAKENPQFVNSKDHYKQSEKLCRERIKKSITALRMYDVKDKVVIEQISNALKLIKEI